MGRSWLPTPVVRYQRRFWRLFGQKGVLHRPYGKGMIGSRCGTLFLDEIGDMPPFASVKLSILWERSIERIGGREKIAATHGLCRDKS